MLYDTVLPGVAPTDRHECPGCDIGFNSARENRSALERALDNHAEALRAFLAKYKDKVPHYPPTCRLKDVRTALIVNSDDEEEALRWEEQVRAKLNEPPLPGGTVRKPD